MNPTLKDDPRFQVLRAKLETLLKQKSPQMYEKLTQAQKLNAYLDQKTEEYWNKLLTLRTAGYSLSDSEQMIANHFEQTEPSPKTTTTPEDLWLSERSEGLIIEADGTTTPKD